MTVIGLAALLKKMELIPVKVVEAAKAALEENAVEIVALMRKLVPVESGALRDSIGWTWGDAPAGSITIGTVKGGKADGRAYGSLVITIYAGTRNKSLGERDAFYAGFQEFGTKNMPANPFFYPAYRAKRGSARARVTRAVKKAVKDA